MTDKIILRRGDPRAPGPRALLQASHALMEALFPPEDNFFLDIEQLCTPDVAFFVVEDGADTLACAALARKEGYGEVKSLFVDEAHRGEGLARVLLDRLEVEARAMDLPMLRLETGNTLEAAHRLYRRSGFTECGPFGDYPDANSSIFMEKALT